MERFKLLVFPVFFLLGFKNNLFAQACILYTRAGDTVVGIIEIKRLKGRLFTIAPGSANDLQSLQEGLRITPRKGKERLYVPSEVKEALIINGFDTLHLLSFSRKSLLPALVMETVVDTSADTHVLVESSMGNGPLIWCTYYLKTEKNETTVWDKNLKMFTTTSYEYQIHTELIHLQDQWFELPKDRNEKNDRLIALLADCPLLVEKLRKNKINVAQKMTKVVSLYNNCRN